MKAIIGEKSIDLKKEDGTWVPKGSSNLELEHISDTQKRVYTHGKVYEITVLNPKNDDGEVELLMNQKKVNVKISTPLDELLHSMGLDNALEVKISHLASPMPGLVIKSLVKAGDTVEKGDPLIVLEAMKMENVLKATSALTIEKVNVTNGQAVEKGAVLIQFA